MRFSENFEAAKNMAVEAAQTAAAKAKELAAVAKANISIYAEEDKVKKAEIELGKLYYRDYAVGEELDTAEYLPWCQKIDESKKAIAELKDFIASSAKTKRPPRPRPLPRTTILRSLSPTTSPRLTRRPPSRLRRRKKPPLRKPPPRTPPRQKNKPVRTGRTARSAPGFSAF
ncbi:MAG: hypothetical protein ACLUN5_01010 [Oscillospiraceae bacterium]